VDKRGGGQSDLEVTVTSSSGEALPVEVRGLTGEEGVDLIEFRPDVPGKYKFSLRYGGEPIPESPLYFNVADGDAIAAADNGSNGADPRQELRVFGMGLQRAQLHAVASFEMEYSDASLAVDRLPDVTIADPRGKAVKSSLSRSGPAGMVVKYTPLRIGNHLIRLHFYSGQVSGSIVKYLQDILQDIIINSES